MTEEVSHASSNPSPNTLSIVNIVCVFSHLCVYVHCVRQRKIQTTATLRQPTAPNVFIATGQFQTQLQTPTCLCFTLGDVAVSRSSDSFITLYFFFLLSPQQLSHTSVSGVAFVSGTCHWGVTVLFVFLHLLLWVSHSCGSTHRQTRPWNHLKTNSTNSQLFSGRTTTYSNIRVSVSQ